ncbi:hypothetical protein [Streptomyces sp. NPDC050538]
MTSPRTSPEVELAPATVRGKPTGPEIHARLADVDAPSRPPKR